MRSTHRSSPCREALESKVVFAAIEDERQNDFGDGYDTQDEVEDALYTGKTNLVFQLSFQKVHCSTLPASSRTGTG